MDTQQHQMEFCEVIPFPQVGAGRVKRRRRAGCPCRCALEKTVILTAAVELLSDAEVAQLEVRLALLRARASASI